MNPQGGGLWLKPTRPHASTPCRRQSMATGPRLLLAAVCGMYATGAALGWGSERLALFMGDFGLSAAALLAALSCFSYARSHRDRRFRPAWLLFALSSAMAALGNAAWGWYEVVLQQPVPRPSVADFCFLLFAPPAIVGLLVLAKRPVTPAGWVCLGLDSWLIGGSLLTVSWSIALAHITSWPGDSVAYAALTLAYPLLDIVLVSIALALRFRRPATDRSAINTAIGALALTVLCDALFTFPLLRDHYSSGRLLDAGWFAGSLLLAYAPWVGRRAQPDDRTRAGAGTAVGSRLARPAVAEPGSSPGGRPAASPGGLLPHRSTTPARTRTVTGPPRQPLEEEPDDEPASRQIAGSLAALAPYLAAAVCTLSLIYNSVDGRAVDEVVLLTGCTVVLALVIRQGIMLLENIGLAHELARQESHFRSLVQGSSDVIMIVASTGVLRYVSPAAAGVYGRDGDQLVGAELTSLIHPEDLARIMHELRRFLAAPPEAEHSTRIECRIRHGAGHWLNIESTVNRHEGGLILNSRDVTERVRLQDQLQHNANHDPLTDLPNRALFTERLSRALTGRRDGDHDTAVLYIDLDGFKSVNDTVGHHAGDELLVHAAQRLRESVRAGDTAARLGGDEFAVLVHGEGAASPSAGGRERRLREIADRLRVTLSEPYRTHDGTEVRIAASIGIAFVEPGISPAALLRNADLAMYRAKQAGKGRVETYTPQPPPRSPGLAPRLPQQSGPRRPGGEEGLAVLHRPIVDLRDGRVSAVAAQIRRPSPQRVPSPPGAFPSADGQPGAEAAARPRLGSRLLEEAVAQAADRHRAGWPTPVTARVCARELVGPPQHSVSIEALLARHDLPPSGLTLELSLSDPRTALDELARRLTTLRELGVTVALDGLGSGYAALTALRRLPLDVLCLERGLVEGIADSPHLRKITSGLLRIAHDLGLSSTADGVDLPEQVLLLRRLGCTHGQGMAFSGLLDEQRLRQVLASGGYPLPAGATAFEQDAQGRPSAGGGAVGVGARLPAPGPARPGRLSAGSHFGAPRDTP